MQKNDRSRSMMEGMVDLYLDALAKNDPSTLPLAAGVAFLENNQPLELGDGIWRTITGIGAYRHCYVDVERGRVGLVGTAYENDVPVMLDVYLEIEDGRMVRIENFIIRDPVGGRRLIEQEVPHEIWLQTVLLEERASREQLVTLADSYFQSMQNNDGKGDYSFFHRDCNRFEHGMQTTNVKKPTTYGHSEDSTFTSLSAEEQWKTGFLGFVTGIRDRRYVVVDVERQAVLAFAMFDHDGSIRSINLTSGKIFEPSPYFDVPRTLQIIEGFRIHEGKLFEIEATMTEVPYGSVHP